jgi:hypothetical protein
MVPQEQNKVRSLVPGIYEESVPGDPGSSITQCPPSESSSASPPQGRNVRGGRESADQGLLLSSNHSEALPTIARLSQEKLENTKQISDIEWQVILTF